MLKRDISRSNVLIAAAGGMIGSGWLFSPFISAQIAGSGALISWILAAIFMLFIALPLCELGAMLPVSGGMTNYPTFTHGKTVGFLFAWIAWLSYVVMTPIEIQAVLQYSSHFFPTLVKKHGDVSELSLYGYLMATVLLCAVAGLNTFGIKLMAECNKYASIIKFIVPTIAMIGFLYTAGSLQNISLNLTRPDNWAAIFSALSTGGIAFAFTGFQNGLMLAGEVKNPQRDIPIAILGAVLIGFILYFFLQLSFLAAIPKVYLAHGWQHLNFPGDSGPLVGLSLLLGLGVISTLLLLDAAFSPLGTSLVYTAATARILYGMASNQHLPPLFLKLNRHQIPYITLYANLLVGLLSFLPFPSWQKMVAFLSSASILSYGTGPICLLALRKLQPKNARPFRLRSSTLICVLGFYFSNLMLYWCGFSILWKLCLATAVGLTAYIIQHRQKVELSIPFAFQGTGKALVGEDEGVYTEYMTEPESHEQHSQNLKGDGYSGPLAWFIGYLSSLLLLSWLGSFGGIGLLSFPMDIILILPFSIITLYFSQRCLVSETHCHSLLPEFALVHKDQE